VLSGPSHEDPAFRMEGPDHIRDEITRFRAVLRQPGLTIRPGSRPALFEEPSPSYANGSEP